MRRYDCEGYPQPVRYCFGVEYVICECSYPVMGPGAKMLPIFLEPGKTSYTYHCLGCGVSGTYYTSGEEAE